MSFDFEGLERFARQAMTRIPLTNEVGDSDRHCLTLMAICLSMRAKSILELGVRHGETTRPLLHAASIMGGMLTSVDKYSTSYVPKGDMAKHWQFIQSDSIKFLEQLPAGVGFDVVYIDDWHAAAHVRRELELIEKVLNPVSVILLHDLMGGDSQPDYFRPSSEKWDGGEWAGGGPYQAVVELDKSKWEWATIPANNGLTILRKVGGVRNV